MKSIPPLNNYLETLAKVGGAMDDDARILAPEGIASERPSYNNYTRVPNRTDSYGQNEDNSYSGRPEAIFSRAILDSQNEGKIGPPSTSVSYGKPPRTVNYNMWYVPGAIVQRAVMEKELRGWTPVFPDNIWLNRDTVSNKSVEEIVMHERVHREDWSKEEIDVRKEMQQRLLTYRGTIADTLHGDRYA